MRKLPLWIAAVTIGVSGSSTLVRADRESERAKSEKAAARGEREGQAGQQKGQRAAQKAERKQEKAEQKREKADLKQMPKAARQFIVDRTKGQSDVDYYTSGTGDAATFGAKYKAANGHMMDMQVDRTGKLISERDETAEAEAAVAKVRLEEAAVAAAAKARLEEEAVGAAAKARAEEAARATEAARMAQAAKAEEAARAGAPTPAPGSASAQGPSPATPDKPGSGRLELAALPKPVQDTVNKQIEGASNVRIYRAKYGRLPVYEAKFTSAKGKDMGVRVDEAGKIVWQEEMKEDDDARADAKDSADDSAEESAAPTGRLAMDDLPKAVQNTMNKETKGARGLRFYRAKYGSQRVYQAKFTSANGKDVSLRVGDDGKIVDKNETDAKKGDSAKSSSNDRKAARDSSNRN